MTDSSTVPLAPVEAGGNGGGYGVLLDDSLKRFFWNAVRTSLTRPSQAYFFYKTVQWQRKAARLREEWLRQGVHVPPIAVFSITNRCNLHCKGCYHQALRASADAEVSDEKLRSIIAEARELGISFMVVGGGEPLVRKEIVDITREFPEIIFLVFTNGLLIDDDLMTRLKGQRNFVPIVSLEGHQAHTDERRGAGVYERLRKTMVKLQSRGIFFGTSLTLTRLNFATLTDPQFVKDLVDSGCRLFFHVEYTAIQEGTEEWVITEEQRNSVAGLVDSFRGRFPAVFVALPSDEEQFGGCLSAGRGFIHISAEGNVEPCPFAPYSDASLKDLSLKDALQSEFLKAIRENQEELGEGEGGCALWVKREWVRSLLHAE